MNLQIWLMFNTLFNHLIHYSVSTDCNISRRPYSLTMYVIETHFLTLHIASAVLDRWISINQSAILFIIGYDIDPNWCVCDIQHWLDEIGDCSVWRFVLLNDNYRSNANTQVWGWLSICKGYWNVSVLLSVNCSV
jgi:hypothetical protein